METLEAPTLIHPFPGLRAFTEEEEHLFFGREKQTDALLNKLRNTRFLGVIGASGSGKSSLVKCGLIPSLYTGFMVSAGSDWQVVVARPGSDPIGNLAEALAKPDVLYDEEVQEFPFQPMIEASLRRNRSGLVNAVKQSDLPPTRNLLVVIDQFEEIFRFSRYEKGAQRGTRDSITFINMLLQASAQMEVPIYIVITMRSDFLGDCTEFRGLPEAINAGQYLIPRMTRSEIKAAITGPIAVAGGRITDRLVTQLLNGVGDNPDQLPILQHALMRTWDNCQEQGQPDAPVDYEHFQAVGGMGRALSLHAEEAYDELKTERERELCQKLFKAITEKASNARGVRRPTKLGEICALTGCSPDEMRPVIEVFRRPGRSFLMPPVRVELTEDTIIDISHESLMRVWTRLIAWVEEESQSVENYLRLCEAASLYQAGKAGLWRDPELALALRWREQQEPTEDWGQRYDPSYPRAMAFLNYSREQNDFEVAEADRRQKQALRRARIVMIVVSLFSLVSMIFAFMAYTAKQEATLERDKARIAEKKSDESRQAALDEKARADTLREKAEALAITAQNRQIAAEKAEAKAIASQQAAEQSAALARQQKILADTAANRASRAKNQAELAQIFAEEQEGMANQLKARADTARQLAESRANSYSAIQLINEGFLKDGIDLALQAHEDNQSNLGPQQNMANYEALFTGIQATSPKSLVYSSHITAIKALCVNQENSQIATGDESGAIHLSSIRNRELKGKLFRTIPEDPIRALTFSQDDKWLLAGTFNGLLVAWEVSSGKKIAEIALNQSIRDLAMIKTRAGWQVAVATPKALEIYQLKDQEFQLSDSAAFQDLTCLTVDQFGEQLLAGSENTIYQYNTLESNFLQSPKSTVVPTRVGSLALTNMESKWAAGMENGKVYIASIDGENSDPTTAAMHVLNSPVTGVAFAPSKDSHLMATASYDHLANLAITQSLLQPSSFQEDKLQLKGHDGWVHAVDFCKDYVVTVSEDATVRIWPSSSNQMAQQLKNYQGNERSNL